MTVSEFDDLPVSFQMAEALRMFERVDTIEKAFEASGLAERGKAVKRKNPLERDGILSRGTIRPPKRVQCGMAGSQKRPHNIR